MNDEWMFIWEECVCLTCGKKKVYPLIFKDGFTLCSLLPLGPERDEMLDRKLKFHFPDCQCTGQFRSSSAKPEDFGGVIPVMDERPAE